MVIVAKSLDLCYKENENVTILKMLQHSAEVKGTGIMKQKVIHMWEIHEIVLYSVQKFENPYTDVTVWAELEGPGFRKRVYGFWDGENVFKIRVTATAPGVWSYKTGASVADSGLTGLTGAYLAIEWTEAEKEANPCRRGVVSATPNGHAMQYADGTPYIMVGDTWWSLATYRYRWDETDTEHPIGPDMSIQDMARHRRSQGYNTVGMITGFPTWKKDGKPSAIYMDDEHETCIRGAWAACSVEEWVNDWSNDSTLGYDDGASDRKVITARDMHNSGGRLFEFPGKIPGYEDLVPDYDRINPEYFKELDKKMNWLNENGFTVFIEALRRDCSKTWKYYYDWPMVYTRYIQYIFARYQANNIIFSPIHFDGNLQSIDALEFNEPINLFIDMYGQPPFGTLLGTNAPGTTKTCYGDETEQHWKTMDQTGNFRDHEHYWCLTDIYHSEIPVPAINGEPYYPGHIIIMPDSTGALSEVIYGNVNSREDQLNFRSCLFGSALCGAFGGLLAGFEGMWSGNVEPEEEPYKVWDTMTFKSSYETRYFRDFLLSEGKRYQELIPDQDMIFPSKSGPCTGWRGWAYCAATRKRDLIMCYTEKDCPDTKIRGLHPYDIYEISFFNPRTGEWLEKTYQVEVTHVGTLPIPEEPDDLDWAFKAKRINVEHRINTERQVHSSGSKVKVKFSYIEDDSLK